MKINTLWLPSRRLQDGVVYYLQKPYIFKAIAVKQKSIRFCCICCITVIIFPFILISTHFTYISLTCWGFPLQEERAEEVFGGNSGEDRAVNREVNSIDACIVRLPMRYTWYIVIISDCLPSSSMRIPCHRRKQTWGRAEALLHPLNSAFE